MIPVETNASLSLRISITDRCTMRCIYCMPEDGVPLASHHDILTYEEIVSLIEKVGQYYSLSKIHITGGDPLVRANITELIHMLSDKFSTEIVLTTNGHLLPSLALPLKRAGLSRINISLDSLIPETFTRITRKSLLDETILGITSALDAGILPVKINTVVLRGINDMEVDDIISFAIRNKCQVRFLELMPVGSYGKTFNNFFISSSEIQSKHIRHHTLTRMDHIPSSSSRYYIARNAKDESCIAGFISPCSEPFCAECNRIRLSADGRISGCLALDNYVSVRHLIANSQTEELINIVNEALNKKRSSRDFNIKSNMASIGG